MWQSWRNHSNEKGIPAQLLVEVREIERHDIQQRTSDRTMAADLRKLVDQLPSATRNSWKEFVDEVLTAIETAPDAVRDRLAAWRKSPSQNKRPRLNHNSPWRCRASWPGMTWPRRSSSRPRCFGRLANLSGDYSTTKASKARARSGSAQLEELD